MSKNQIHTNDKSATVLPVKHATLKEVLMARHDTHGDFICSSNTVDSLIESLEHTPNWETMASDQRRALRMICEKMARITHGTPDLHDHWEDIAGYAMLIAGRL